MRKKKYNQFLLSNAFNVCNMEVLKHFVTKKYARRFDIAEIFLRHFPSKYILENILNNLALANVLVFFFVNNT